MHHFFMDWNSLFGDTLVRNIKEGVLGDVKTEEIVAADMIGIYFSVSWSPVCKIYTPALINIYRTLRSDNKRFVIIYVPCEDQETWLPYFHKMPWLSVPGSNKTVCDYLRRKFDVTGVPRLVLMDNTGEVLVENARNANYFSLDVSKETIQFVWSKIWAEQSIRRSAAIKAQHESHKAAKEEESRSASPNHDKRERAASPQPPHG